MLHNLIVAYDLKRGIGSQGQMAWNLTDDLKRFRETTTQPHKNCVIMGRKTWDSLPEKFKPLPNRINIILSSSLALEVDIQFQNQEQTYVCKSWDDVDTLCDFLNRDKHITECFIMGGAEIYRSAMERYPIHRYYLTHVFNTHQCDTFLPQVNLINYSLLEAHTIVTPNIVIKSIKGIKI